MMMRRSVSVGPMPSDLAAMFWLRSTEMMPPRMISPLNAASLSAKPMTAVVKVSNLSPMRGSASKMKTSCRSCGVPRMNQM